MGPLANDAMVWLLPTFKQHQLRPDAYRRAAHGSDVQMLPALSYGEERRVWG